MDNKQVNGSPDRDRINLNEDYEVQYWSKKFGVSPAELKKAVSEAESSSAAAIEKHLKK
ncbi:DUF3606 domain-containing protein [Pedobacter sp. HMF7647]|uniref:DUF3606 domain-containing protein n=1 Tax=Hufsiella arboris TaxID=2695275 RepID=A0A7K1YF04_9SPHI|nr:DUF3606 domain-containing protein [Hufsiella arboris]MXV53184.1 DUF3606 domain-containing protein [Hufsiella arboris]